jgi:hypothetical protein
MAELGGMAAALALGLSSNYYGVLAFFPIAVGEIVRAGRMRRFAPGAWVAMALAALPLLAYLPLIRHNMAEFRPHAWNRTHGAMIAESYLELVEGLFWPVLGLGAYAAWRFWRPRSHGSRGESSGAIGLHEIAAVGVLLAYPVLGFAIAAGGAGMISPRCVVPVCCGFGIAAALLCRRVFGMNAPAGVAILSIALVWVAARESACGIVLHRQKTAFFKVRDLIARVPAGRPIVVADSLFVLPLAHYSSEAVRERIVFPIDFDAIHRLEKDDSGEQNLWSGRDGIFPVRIVPYDSAFLKADRLDALEVVSRRGGWLPQRLAADGFGAGDFHFDDPAWEELGGVFTPLDHEETRAFAMTRPYLTP